MKPGQIGKGQSQSVLLVEPLFSSGKLLARSVAVADLIEGNVAVAQQQTDRFSKALNVPVAKFNLVSHFQSKKVLSV